MTSMQWCEVDRELIFVFVCSHRVSGFCDVLSRPAWHCVACSHVVFARHARGPLHPGVLPACQGRHVLSPGGPYRLRAEDPRQGQPANHHHGTGRAENMFNVWKLYSETDSARQLDRAHSNYFILCRNYFSLSRQGLQSKAKTISDRRKILYSWSVETKFVPNHNHGGSAERMSVFSCDGGPLGRTRVCGCWAPCHILRWDGMPWFRGEGYAPLCFPLWPAFTFSREFHW